MALLIELILDENKKGISAISIVDVPAILTNFIKLADEDKKMKFAVDGEQMVITGPALIPNVKIYRTAESMGTDQDAYVYFSDETIKQIAEIFLETLKNNETTLDHEEETDDLKLRESWIIEDTEKDKAAMLGFELPVGTWMVSYKVQNADLWDEIKAGDYNGFSIEAEAFAMIPKGTVSLSDQPEDTREVLTVELQGKVLEQFKKVGSTWAEMNKKGWELVVDGGELTEKGLEMAMEFAITSNPDANSSLDKGNYAIRYSYEGPRDDLNREFCAEVLDADLVYTKEDIMQGTNPDFGSYNIFEYKGSYNCRHNWKRLTFKKTENSVGEADVTDYRPVPPGDLPDSYLPSDEEATTVNNQVMAKEFIEAIDSLSKL